LFYIIKLRPEDAHDLIWERFINNRGIPGHNKSLDLDLENMNNFLKELLKNLRSNLNEQNAERISKAMNNIQTLMEQTEESLHIRRVCSGINKADRMKSVRHLATELNKSNPFKDTNKSYESFPNFDGKVLNKLDCTKYLKWVIEKRAEFKPIFGDL